MHSTLLLVDQSGAGMSCKRKTWRQASGGADQIAIDCLGSGVPAIQYDADSTDVAAADSLDGRNGRRDLDIQRDCGRSQNSFRWDGSKIDNPRNVDIGVMQIECHSVS